MPREANKVAAKPLKLSATPKLQKHLEALVLKELYGRTPTEVAQRLLEERIRVLVVEGTLKALDDEVPAVTPHHK